MHYVLKPDWSLFLLVNIPNWSSFLLVNIQGSLYSNRKHHFTTSYMKQNLQITRLCMEKKTLCYYRNKGKVENIYMCVYVDIYCKNYSVKITSWVVILLSVHWPTFYKSTSHCHDGGKFYTNAISTFRFMLCKHLSIVGCHEDAFAIWNVEHYNNQSCYKEWEIYILSCAYHTKVHHSVLLNDVCSMFPGWLLLKCFEYIHGGDVQSLDIPTCLI